MPPADEQRRLLVRCVLGFVYGCPRFRSAEALARLAAIELEIVDG